MPSYVVKPKADEDFYVVWSTIVDAPTGWGSREQLPKLSLFEPVTPERLDRADIRGTSMCDPGLPADRQWFGWNDREFIVMEVDIPNRGEGSYGVPRENVRALCERLTRGEDPTDLLTFEPWEDAPIGGEQG